MTEQSDTLSGDRYRDSGITICQPSCNCSIHSLELPQDLSKSLTNSLIVGEALDTTLHGVEALPYKSKLGSEIHPSRSFVEMVKASMQGRKHSHQPSIRETKKIQVVENTMSPPRDEAGI